MLASLVAGLECASQLSCMWAGQNLKLEEKILSRKRAKNEDFQKPTFYTRQTSVRQ